MSFFGIGRWVVMIFYKVRGEGMEILRRVSGNKQRIGKKPRTTPNWD